MTNKISGQLTRKLGEVGLYRDMKMCGKLFIAWIPIVLLLSSCSVSPNYPLRTFGDLLIDPAIDKNVKEAYLGWYVYYSSSLNEEQKNKKLYLEKIENYLRIHPESESEIVNAMRKCTIIIGMTQEQVLAMADPTQKYGNTFLYYSRFLENGREFGGGSTVSIRIRKAWVTFSYDRVVYKIDVLG
ncbi:MAG: hypothetical protein Q8O13_05100 [Candidatus Omnitrophota bacterium]|nr:hypothetical protein [Candidatus Omnitrophota bacterium]